MWNKIHKHKKTWNSRCTSEYSAVADQEVIQGNGETDFPKYIIGTFSPSRESLSRKLLLLQLFMDIRRGLDGLTPKI